MHNPSEGANSPADCGNAGPPFKDLSGCESLQLPVLLRRFLSTGRISSISYHRLLFVIRSNSAQ